MPPIIALITGIAFAVYLYKKDNEITEVNSLRSWLFAFWFGVMGSRPLTLWAARSMAGGDNSGTEGNPVNLIFGLVAAVIAVTTLSRKKVDFAALIRLNFPLFILSMYCLLSCVWSDYPFVSFRRWIRYLFDLLVVMAILTEPSPLIAIKTVIKRYAIFAAPLSLVLIKYYPHLATGWNAIGSKKMWTGVCTHKNTLGVGLAIILLFFFWKYIILRDKKNVWVDVLLVALSTYILVNPFDPNVKGSSTAIIALIVGVFLLLIMRFFKKNIKQFALIFYLLIGSYFVTDFVLKAVFNETILEKVTEASGRDMTFTGRTFIWDAVLELAAHRPILGTGYGVFWTGRRLAILSSNPYVGTIKQAHSGYIETYANLGIVGALLLIFLLFSTLQKQINNIELNFEKKTIATSVVVMVIVSEFFEATVLTPGSFKWVVFMLFTVEIPVAVSQEYELA